MPTVSQEVRETFRVDFVIMGLLLLLLTSAAKLTLLHCYNMGSSGLHCHTGHTAGC